MTHVLIVGAGPAGLMAAIAAAGRGARAVVREQLDRPGAKLLASGGGRCNLTNTADEAAFVAAFGRQGRFILPALRAFGPAALRRFLADRGVPTGAADGFRVLPRSGRAADVLNALLDECGRLGVTVRCGTPVTGLLLSGGLTASAVQVPPAVPTVRVCGVVAGGREIAADAVIVAAGGAGWPELGGTGGGYALARQAGHALVEPSPSLVGLVTVEPWPRSCAGVSLPQARVWIDAPATGRGAGRAPGRRAERRGEVLLTHEGVSGPAVLDLSGDVAEMLRRGGPVQLRVELEAGTSAPQWERRFDDWQRDAPRRQTAALLAGRLPRSLAETVCRLGGGVGAVRAGELPRAARRKLSELLAALPLTVTATGGLRRAMVTRGGVALRQVSPDTLASRLAAGLHFAGEVLDLDGPCGGYNLQWAFSSGYLAGASCGGAEGAAH